MSQLKAKYMDLFKMQFNLLEKKMNGSASSPAFETRKAAFNKILETGLPSRKDEEYKYTPLARQLEKQMAGFTENPETTINIVKGIRSFMKSEGIKSIKEITGALQC